MTILHDLIGTVRRHGHWLQIIVNEEGATIRIMTAPRGSDGLQRELGRATAQRIDDAAARLLGAAAGPQS